MKCDKCKFVRCQSNEYGTEYYCAAFGDDVPEEFETYEGCNLRYNEAKKLCELNDKCIEKYYGSMYVLCALSDGNPTKEQEEIEKELRKKQKASLRKLKKAVQSKKEVDEFVKKLKEKENE